jgi:hypothetical protein
LLVIIASFFVEVRIGVKVFYAIISRVTKIPTYDLPTIPPTHLKGDSRTILHIIIIYSVQYIVIVGTYSIYTLPKTIFIRIKLLHTWCAYIDTLVGIYWCRRTRDYIIWFTRTPSLFTSRSHAPHVVVVVVAVSINVNIYSMDVLYTV